MSAQTSALLDPAGLAFEALPIDNERGVPQELTHVVAGAAYHVRLYANLDAEAVTDEVEFFELPSDAGHLVVRVERQGEGGERETVFLRKVVPGVLYPAGDIVLEFPEQRLARANINGRGNAGSSIVGRVAPRWA